MEKQRSKKRFFTTESKKINISSISHTLGVHLVQFDIDFLQMPALDLAPRLIGNYLCMLESEGLVVGGRIVETEAYQQDDPASHSYCGMTTRNRLMFARGGLSYVYRSYGIHWCFNVVSGREGVGEAVLIRALEPLWGISLMEERRSMSSKRRELCNGPGKLCQALAISDKNSGLDLMQGPMLLLKDPLSMQRSVLATRRVGISKAVDRPWRFLIAADHPYISRPRPRPESSSKVNLVRIHPGMP
ncbi:MAG: DNA-3-methyladenine glycosylase [Oligoflexus sp.]